MLQDVALTDDIVHPVPDTPASPAERLDAIATILAAGVRRRRRQLAVCCPNIAPCGGTQTGLDLPASPCPDGSAG
ncbi:MAG: hypothetical protein L0Y42_04060 [Phycisphaerales bacterium]|nr:hypothetical protein [Phycisphaerales bacterium]